MKGTSISVWNGDVNGALRKLKKILERADRQKELSKREFYEKPSAKRKKAKAAGRKRWLKIQEKQKKGRLVNNSLFKSFRIYLKILLHIIREFLHQVNN